MESKKLKKYRKKIDYIDKKIISLLANRMEIVDKVGKLKKKLDMDVVQSNRWGEVMSRLEREGDKMNLDVKFVNDIWNRIHEESISQQKK